MEKRKYGGQQVPYSRQSDDKRTGNEDILASGGCCESNYRVKILWVEAMEISIEKCKRSLIARWYAID